ncbi:hypothetical protein D9758_013634 [Tetrapyrgos nigripes]|uniref:Uncharacterized protein n=1 Tax=Tetrapyrgos nigripes TaxID=182062 RepID=A0A8H5CPF2_9AGAR|nr:hypothetical protein D9758_013634 [Tetrapyrgos nigripes]
MDSSVFTFTQLSPPSPFSSLDKKQSSPLARWKRLVKQVVRTTTPRINIIDILDEARPGRPLPNLPPELWIMILRYACLPPEPRTRSAAGEDQSFLDTPSYYLPSSHPHYTPSSSLPPPSPLSRISSNTSDNNTSSNTDYPYPTSASLNPHRTSPAHHFYRTLMDQKRSFALVSKLWNAYSQPALYEWVWLSNKRQAKALALTILCQVVGVQ